MSFPVPKYVAAQYEDGAHGFRAEKRKQLEAMWEAYGNLRTGCFHFPCGRDSMDEIEALLDILTDALSVKTWGK